MIFYVGLIIFSLTILPNSIFAIQLPGFATMFMSAQRIDSASSQSIFYTLIILGGLLATVLVVLYPKKIMSEMNFWLLIAIFLLLPFAYSRDTKENFLLVKETTLRVFLISMFAMYFFRKLSTGLLLKSLSEVPWHFYAFTAFAVTSFIWSESYMMTFHYSLIIVSYLVFYIVTSDTLRKPWQLYSISDILITAAAIASMYGILQYYRVAGTNHNYDPLFGAGEVIGNTDRKRVFSFFGNPVFLGVYLDAALPIAFAMFFSSFAAGARWAHKYEKYILRSQIILLSFAIVYSLVFMGLANSSVNALIETSKLPGGEQLSDSRVSDLITTAGSTSFMLAPIVFACLMFGATFLYQLLPYWQQHEKQIYRLANGLFSFLAIFVCIFVTFTRTAWIATAASLFFFAVYTLFYAHDLIYAYRKWIVTFAIALVTATIFLTVIYFKPNSLNTGTESIAGRFTSSFTVLQRIMLYDITINAIKLNPILGHGFGTFGKLYPTHQAKFYKGEFRYIIDWLNSFFKMTPPNKAINFTAWCFEKVTTSRFFQFLMMCYFVVFMMGGILLLIYYKDIRNITGLLSQTVIAYLLAIIIPVAFIFIKFLGSAKTYLGTNENIMSINPQDYYWLSAGFAHVHNEYLQVWVDLGIFALFIFLYAFYDYFYKGGKLLKALNFSADRILIIGYLCAVIAMLVESLANFPFQRIMPILIATVGFSAIFNGRKVFSAEIALADAANSPVDAPADSVQNIQTQNQRPLNYKTLDNIGDEVLFDDHLAFNGMEKEKRNHLNENITFYAVVSASLLILNYFPARYVAGNVDLKSGHTFISQAQMMRNDEDKFRIIINEGIRYLERSCQRVPYNAEAMFWWGDTLKLLGDYDKAIEKINMAIELAPSKHSYFSRGIAYFEKFKQLGDKKLMDQAISDWKSSIAVNPNYSNPLFHLGYHEFLSENFQAAFDYFKESIKWESSGGYSGESYKFGGVAAYRLNKDTEAILFLNEAQKQGVRGISKYLGLMLAAKGDYQGAMPVLEEAIRELPNDKEVYSALISAYQRLNKLERAIEVVNQKHEKKDTPEYFYELGKIYSAIGNSDKALIELGRGLEKNPNDIKLNEEIGRIYFDNKKDYQAATAFFDKVVKLAPGNLRTAYNLGACYYRTGNNAKALEIWKEVKKRDPRFHNIDEYIKSAERPAGASADKATAVTPGAAPNISVKNADGASGTSENSTRGNFFNY